MRSSAALALALLVSVGCTDGLDVASNVHDLRLLAVASDPPDFVMPALDPSSPIPPAIPAFNLKVLIGDAYESTRTITYRITTCAKPDKMRCENVADGGAEPVLLIGEGTVVPERGLAEATATLGTIAHLPVLMPLLQAAVEKDQYRGFGGLPLFIAVHLSAGGEEVWGGSRIPIWLPIPKPTEGLKPNVAPLAPKLLIEEQPLVPEVVPQLSGKETKLDIVPVDPALRESYVVPSFDGDTIRLTESWKYAWYTTKGYFSPETSGGRNPVLQKDMETKTKLVIAESEPPGPLRIVVIVRDGRGGESWTTLDANYTGP